MKLIHHSHLKLLGHCLIADELDAPELKYLKEKLASESFNWKRLCDLAGTYWLLPYLHETLDRVDLLDFVPPEVKDELNTVRHLTKARNQRIKDQLEQAIDVLNQYDIQPLLLKGASYLLKPISPIQQCRMISDIDILVPEKSISQAIDALKTDGYQFMNFLPDGTSYHLDPMTKESMPARLELHIKPLANDDNGLICANNAWLNAELIKKNQPNYYIFTPEFRLIHQFAHAQLHSRDYANDRLDLRQLYDFHLMRKDFADSIKWSLIDQKIPDQYQPVWQQYVLMANLFFSELDRPAITTNFEQRLQAKKLFAKLQGAKTKHAFYHWFQRMTRLPQRLSSPLWYLSKYRYLLNKS